VPASRAGQKIMTLAIDCLSLVHIIDDDCLLNAEAIVNHDISSKLATAGVSLQVSYVTL
jgi:hypothetical protein